MAETSLRTSRLTSFDFVVAPFILFVGTIASLWPLVSNLGSAEFMGMGDPWRYAGPVLFYSDYWIHQGELPLWNPLVNCGQPFAANPQSFLFYPPNLLRSLLTFSPTPYRTHVGILVLIIAQMTAGAYGAYLLARSHRFGHGPSLVAALAFGLSGGAVTVVIGFWYFHNALMWLPYLVWAMRCSLLAPNRKQALTWASVAGLLYGMVLLAGTPIFMVAFGMFVGVYVLLHRIVYYPWREHLPARRFFAGLVGDLVALAIVLGVGVLVASPLLLPAIEFSSYSMRAGADPSGVERMGENMLKWNLIEILAIYPGDERYQALRGAGAGVLFLALVGLISTRKRELLVFGGLFLFAVDCARDEPLLFGHVLAQLAPFKISGPGRVAPLMCLALGLLAALGLEAIAQRTKSATARTRLTVMTLLAATVVLGTLWATVPPHPLFVFGSIPLIVPAGLAIGAIITIWIRRPKKASVYLALLVFGEIIVWNQYYMPHFFIANPAGLYPKGVEYLKSQRSMWDDNSRITYPLVNMQMYDLQPAINGYDPLFISDVAHTLTGTPPSTFDRVIAPWSIAANKHSGFLKRAFWLTRDYAVGELPPSDRPFPYTTTVFLREPLPPPYKQVDAAKLPVRAYSDDVTIVDLLDGAPIELDQAVRDDERGDPIAGPGPKPDVKERAVRDRSELLVPKGLDTMKHSVLGITLSAPRETRLFLFLSDRANDDKEFALVPLTYQPYQPYPAKPYWELPLPDFDESRLTYRYRRGDSPSAVIQELSLYQDNADESRFIQIEQRTANSVKLSVGPLAEPRILLFVDAYYPGWKAFVDGKPTTILRANDVFKAVTLSPGTHSVRFVFTSPRTYVGIGLSLITVAIVIVVFWRVRRSG